MKRILARGNKCATGLSEDRIICVVIKRLRGGEKKMILSQAMRRHHNHHAFSIPVLFPQRLTDHRRRFFVVVVFCFLLVLVLLLGFAKRIVMRPLFKNINPSITVYLSLTQSHFFSSLMHIL